MRKLALGLLACLLLLSPSAALSETIDDLVERDGIFYKKFSEVPFSGKTTGRLQVTVKNGHAEGAWVYYHDNGQLGGKGSFKEGKREGVWVKYDRSGQLKAKETYKNGELVRN